MNDSEIVNAVLAFIKMKSALLQHHLIPSISREHIIVSSLIAQLDIWLKKILEMKLLFSVVLLILAVSIKQEDSGT